MSILNVNTIQPVGSGQTITVSATNISAPSTVVTASSFVGNVTGSVSGGSFSGISTAGITTAYIGSINDGPISGARNRIINGDMRLDQRNAGASVTPTTLTYTVDRWAAVEQTDGSMTVQQSGTVPVGFTSSLLVTVTSADSSLGATQYATLRQGIEGLNISDLNWGTSNAQPVTLSFWVRSSLTGAFGGAIQNNAQDRSYPFSYTINSANTFEYKTVTIPGDTTGTWLTNNSAGMFIWFSFAAGSTYSGTAATWASSLLFAPTSATNLLGTNGATWYLTGVQLEPGTVATPFERRSYGQELILAQRYYEFGYINPVTFTDQYGNAVWYGFYRVEKRATGTLSYDDTDGNSSRIARWFTGSYSTNVQPTRLSVDNVRGFSGYIGSLSAGTLVKVGFNWYQNSEL